MTRRRDDYLTIGQTADYLDLAVDTVRRLETAGELQATRTAGGHRRFRRDVVEAFRVQQETGGRRTSPPSRPPTPPRPPAPAPFRPTRPVHAAAPVIDPEDELPEDWDDPDLWQDDQPPPPPPRHATPATLRQETSIGPAPRAQELDMQRREEEQRRLNRIKAHGVNMIPYDVPPQWRGKVVEDLNQ